MPDDDFRHIDNRLDIEAELHAFHGRVSLDVRLGREVRVHAQRDSCLRPHRLCDLADGEQFLFALDVEEKDAVFECEAHLGVGLADTGEDDLGAGRPALRAR